MYPLIHWNRQTGTYTECRIVTSAESIGINWLRKLTEFSVWSWPEHEIRDELGAKRIGTSSVSNHSSQQSGLEERHVGRRETATVAQHARGYTRIDSRPDTTKISSAGRLRPSCPAFCYYWATERFHTAWTQSRLVWFLWQINSGDWARRIVFEENHNRWPV